MTGQVLGLSPGLQGGEQSLRFAATNINQGARIASSDINTGLQTGPRLGLVLYAEMALRGHAYVSRNT